MYINTVGTLLKVAKVPEVAMNTLPQILQTLTDNKVILKEQALKEVLSLLQSAPSATSVAYESIFISSQKAHEISDKQSLTYLKELLSLFQSSGISDERFTELFKQIELHEHEIRKERTKGVVELAKLAVVGVTTVVVAVIMKPQPKKHPFWYK